MMRKRAALALCLLLLILGLSGCGKKADPVKIQITMENGGVIVAELYPDVAPITVKNFVELTQKGFYNGLTFHRISPGFVIQGGDPTATGTGGSGTAIKGEFSKNGVKNTLSHKRGVLSMARRPNDENSATSQFFIVLKDVPSLDGEYAAFGKVISGMEVVDQIAKTPCTGETPNTPVVMKEVKVIK